jgi:Cu2+-containing amine oxidase
LEGIQRPGGGTHPLDPLTASEVAAVAATVQLHEAFASLSERARFVSIAVRERPKDAVLGWAEGGSTPRREAEGAGFRLDGGVLSWQRWLGDHCGGGTST